MRSLLLLLVLLLVPVVGAQDLVVTASSPADHTTSVALSETVSFTFSEALAAPPFVVFTPEDAIAVGEPVLSADGRTVSYAVTHQPETAYVHLVVGAQGADGQPLGLPYALNYTTAASEGAFTVTGDVNGDGVDVRGTIVALVTGDLATGDVRIASASVITASGGSASYSVGPAPIALYTAGAVLVPEPALGRPFAFGFYDPEGDGTPNPIIVPFNIDVTLQSPAPVTALANANAAITAAQGEVPDAEFVSIPTTPVDNTGRSGLWPYQFYSPSQMTLTTVLATDLLPLVTTLDAPDGPPTGGALIPVPFEDSDAALATAESAGGSAFRAEYAGQPILVTLRGGHFPDDFAHPDAFWRVTYRALETEGGPAVDSLGVFIDMATGDLLGTTATTGDAPAPELPSFTLSVAWPNPFQSTTRLAYTLTKAADVRLTVVDLLGREVAVIEQARQRAGTHQIAWQPQGLAPGVYVLRLEGGSATEARVVVYRP